jgi:hypothetical protein
MVVAQRFIDFMNLVLKGFLGTIVALAPQEIGIASQWWWATDAHTNNTVHALILIARIFQHVDFYLP